MGGPSSIEKFQEDDRKKYMNYKLLLRLDVKVDTE